jgi:hypothetical protein
LDTDVDHPSRSIPPGMRARSILGIAGVALHRDRTSRRGRIGWVPRADLASIRTLPMARRIGHVGRKIPVELGVSGMRHPWVHRGWRKFRMRLEPLDEARTATNHFAKKP